MNKSDIYVVVADNDQAHKELSDSGFVDDGGPLVFEQYTKTSSLDDASDRIAKLGGRYGKCRIARLVFIDAEK